MAKIDSFSILKKEDFDSKDANLVDKLAFVINPVLTQLESILNKNIDFDNLRQEIKDVIVEVNGSGTPKILTQIKNNLLSKVRGIQVIKAENLTNSLLFSTSQPFITFNENNKIITIANVTGLQADNKYKLTVITYG
jgi:hypothetical protein